ncbi:MAG TPA: glycosyltransferase [Ktedonobacteraceae bacterium]|nr:glycosyltransferase [Ktedonobacteraceae bacterium]
MLALQIFKWLLLAIEIVIALPVLYLSILSISAILAARRLKKRAITVPSPSQRASFAILVPAHNEIAVLGQLLKSLASLDYPQERYTVYVVADNCTDATAELARATGRTEVYERFDQEKRGKGFALNWLIQKLDEDCLVYDAYIILDADSVVAPSFLQEMNKGLTRGAHALQANNNVLNFTESASTALRWIAMTLMNHVRPLGRNGIGCSSTLTGNGMCLSRSLLVRYPWQSFSLAEDYQYYLSLMQHGEKVLYMPEAIVRSEMPSTFAQMRTQDIRWEAPDNSQPAWITAWKLLKAGVRKRDLIRIEAIAELLTPPLSYLAGSYLLVLVGSLLVGSLSHLIVSLVITGGLLCYFGTAIYLLRPPRTVFRALLHAPGFMLWKLWVILVVRRRKKHTAEWVRTSRTIS